MKFFGVVFASIAAMAVLARADQSDEIRAALRHMSDIDEPMLTAAQTYSDSRADPNERYSNNDNFARNQNRGQQQQQTRAQRPAAPAAEQPEEDEENKEEDKPDRLQILLGESKFTCDGLKGGYYADETVGCQVFHYCVEDPNGGMTKHSWQCPEDTVFHQIHLNCVPAQQDICGSSSKYHVVNEYLHKEREERGPNNTVLYHQRYYPEDFDIGGGDPVLQIFAAHARAQAQAKAKAASGVRDEYEEDERPAPRARAPQQPRHKPQPAPQQAPKPQYSYQPAPQQSRPSPPPPQQSYKPVSRPIPTSYQPSAPAPTKRPSFQPEFNDSVDDYNSEFAPSQSSSSSGSSGAVSSQYPASSITIRKPEPQYSAPASSSSSNSQSNSAPSRISFRPSSSSRPYPTRSLGIPIASFRVAPSAGGGGYTGSVQPSSSNIQEVIANLGLANTNNPSAGQVKAVYIA